MEIRIRLPIVKLAYRGAVLARGAMFLRNSLILAILAVQAFTYAPSQPLISQVRLSTTAQQFSLVSAG